MANVVAPTMLALIVLLALSSTPTSSHPITADKCRTGCHGSTPNNFKYAEGTTYKYNLESTVDITLSTAEGQQSATKVKATVLLTQQAQCVQVLRLQNVQIFGGDGKKKGSIPNVDKAIKINFHDGHIEDIICAESGDTQVSLNMKRAIASLFQAAVKDTTETDIFGTCPTTFTTSKEGAITTFTKTRSLNQCGHREHAKHDFISTAFNIHSEIKSSPILRSDYTSEMRVKDGILDHVLATENYLYMPFSIGKNGAKAIVQTKLQLTGKSKDAPKNKCQEPKSIIFENPHPTVSDKSDVKTIVDAVKDTANSIKETVSEKTASKFGQLITVMSYGKKDDLLAVYNQVQSGAGFADKEKAKKVFLDALFRTGTGECLEVAIQLLKSKQLTPIEEKMVYLGMSFIRHATPESISAAASLLDIPKLRREAYLGIGALAHHYCQTHDCNNIEQMKTLSGKLLAKLKDGKANNKDQENEMISTLKALTNMKHLADNLIPKLTAIAQDKKNSMRLRVAALDAYKSDMCKDKLRDSAVTILKDTQQDIEIRLKAYLALAECPNAKVATAIKNILDTDESYHILGFIVSHIRQLRASNNPDKELAKSILGGINTSRHFPIDPRKYSFYDEASHSINTLGTSGSYDTSVIYSQNSFLPRSIGVNLTAEIFGHRINFLEVDTRQENLDKLMEHYLGPLGVLRNSKPDELIKAGKGSLDNILGHLNERLKKTRGKRHVPQGEIDKMGKDIQIKTNDLNNDLDLDLSIKIFGSEFLFLTLNENHEDFTPEKIIDKIFDCLDQGIEKAKHFQHTYTRNGIFLDLELSYPTTTGFPLRLSIEGTDSLQLVAETKVDIRQLLQGSKQSAMSLKLIPSANIEMSGRLTLDAFVVESGLKVTSNLHTATGGALSLELFQHGIDAKFNLPIAKQEIVNAEHSLVFITRDTGHTEVEVPLRFVESKPLDICIDHLEQVLGLTFCAGLNSPTQPMNQGVFLPFQLKVFVTRDKDITYHIRDILYNSDRRGVEFMVETLDENKKPMVSVAIEAFSNPEKYIKATLDSPIKKATVEGRIIDTDKEKSIGAKLVHDGQVYSGKLGISVTGNQAKSTYKPLIEFVTPEAQQKSPYQVDGQIIAEKSGENYKYTFDNVKLSSPSSPQIKITGNLGVESSQYFCDLKIDDGQNSGSVKGKLQANSNLLKTQVKVMNTMAPQSNFDLSYELKRDDHSISNDLVLIHGGELNDKQNTLTLKNSVSNKFTDKTNYLFETKNQFSYPLIGTDLKFNLKKIPKVFDLLLEGKYNKAKVMGKVNLKYNQKNLGDYDFSLEADLLENVLKAKLKRDINGDVSTIDNNLEANSKKLQVKGTITHKVKPHDIDIGCDLTIMLPGCPDQIAVKNIYQHAGDNCKMLTKILKGQDALVDFDFVGHKTKGGNGHIKMNLKDVLVVNGELKADNWNGKAFVVADLQKLGRKIKVDSTFNLVKPKYVIEGNFYPNFEKTQQKISISSDNEVKDKEFDSKNKLSIFDNVFELNTKGSCDSVWNGKTILEGDLTLPNGMWFSSKMNHDVKTENDLLTGKILFAVEQRNNKNTPGRKLTIAGEGKNTNVKLGKVDLKYQLQADDSNGKNLNGDLTIKYNKEGDDHKGDIACKLTGTVLKEPVDIKYSTEYKPKAGKWSGSSNCGQAKVAFDGKYDFTKEVSGGVNVDVELKNNPSVKTIKFGSSGKLLKEADKTDLSGALKLIVDDDGTNPDTLVHFETDHELSIGHHNGQIKSMVKVQKLDPVSVALSYGHKEEGGVQKCLTDASIKYEKDKTLKLDMTLERKTINEGKLEMKLETPYDNYKKTDLTLTYKRSDDKNHLVSELVANVDGKQYVSKSEVRVSSVNPLFKMEATHDGHTDKLILSAENPGNHQHKAEATVVHQDKTYSYSYDINAPSIDDFTVIIKLQNPNFEHSKLDIELKNKKNKVIEVTVLSNGENLVKGTANYKARDESGKYIIEGSGEFTVKNDKKTGNFKFIKQSLTQEKNHEVGTGVTLDVTLGDHAIDAEAKMTNKQFKIMNSYCKEKNQCQHVEIDSKSNIISIAEYDNEVEIRIELAQYDFGLKSVSKRKQLQYDHTTDVHFQTKDNKKYSYSLYFHPKTAGVSLTTPKRQIALESKIDIAPKLKGVSKFDVALWLDKKNAPNKKTLLSGQVESQAGDKSSKLSSDLKLSSPGLSKDLVLSYVGTFDVDKQESTTAVVIDIFQNQNAKLMLNVKSSMSKFDSGKYDLVSHATLKSLGMGIDITYDEITYALDTKQHSFKTMSKLSYGMNDHKCVCQYLFEITPEKLTTKIQLHNKLLVAVDAKMKFTKDNSEVDSEVTLFGVKPLKSHWELKNLNTMKYTLSPKDNPGKKLTVNAALIPGQIADLRADVSQQELLKASVQLDEANFLKPDYALNLDNVQKLLLQPGKLELDNFIKESKVALKDSSDSATKMGTHFSESIKKNLPNIKGVKDYYNAEWTKVTSEINADPNIQKLNELLHKLFGAFAKITSELLTKFMEIAENVVKTIKQSLDKLFNVLDTQILPSVKNLLESLGNVLKTFIDNMTDIIFGVLNKINEFLEAHQKELKQIATTLSTISQDIGRFIQKNYERIRGMVSEHLKKLYEELKALPIYDELKARYEMLVKDFGDWGEPLKHMIDDTLNTLQDIIPSDEAKKIVELIRSYINKKLKNEAVDDVAAIENILRQIAMLIKKITNNYNVNQLPAMDTKNFISDYFFALPKLTAVKISWFDYFLVQKEGPWESIPDTLYGLSFNPRSYLGPPFRLYGYLVQGQHVFTFDGKHLTFPGSCNYLIARDAVNGNFTVGGTYSNGLLTALTVADLTESVTIKKGGQIMHGKAAAEFPLRVGTINAFRTYGHIHVNSKSGVEVTCDVKLTVCKVSVSGFYHGQLRGLLGNGNNEPFDDFMLPNGKLVASESDFGNGYKMTASCKAVTTPDHGHGHARNPECTKLFTSEVTLRVCYPFVNPALWRMACDHGVAAGVKDTEEALVRGYVEACKAKFIPAVVPERFMTCTNGDQEHKFGEKFSVKLPGKAADVILIVEQAKANEQVYKDLVQPMVSELTKELNGKGINDVEFHLVGYGGEYAKWPSHFTNGGKMSWKGKLPAMKFADSGAEKLDSIKTGNDKIDHAIKLAREVEQDIKLALGLDIKAQAFWESYRYPFRAHATKTIIAFNSEPCQQGKLLPLQKLRAMLFNDKSIHINLVSTFEDFKVKDAKVSKTVIGFDDKHVMTFADAKKKSAGSTELYKELEVNDFCSDFLVKHGGAVFNADNFIAAKGPQRAQFAQMVSHTLATQIINTEQGLDCECTIHGLSTARNVCKSVYINHKEK